MTITLRYYYNYLVGGIMLLAQTDGTIMVTMICSKVDVG